MALEEEMGMESYIDEPISVWKSGGGMDCRDSNTVFSKWDLT